ncbi:hypothetical protein K8353_41865, partial [Burkholderia contaminans]|nr:hypothetical protein [Burkholderia contaminans]
CLSLFHYVPCLFVLSLVFSLALLPITFVFITLLLGAYFLLLSLLTLLVDVEYLKEVKDVNINPALIEEFGKDMKIVYTPLHGTGEMLARRALAQAGFDSVQVVEAQATADPDFSTVTSPNPESQAAFALAEELGRQVGADVLVATDPDADRVGVEVLQKDGSYLNLSGN